MSAHFITFVFVVYFGWKQGRVVYVEDNSVIIIFCVRVYTFYFEHFSGKIYDDYY